MSEIEEKEPQLETQDPSAEGEVADQSETAETSEPEAAPVQELDPAVVEYREGLVSPKWATPGYELALVNGVWKHVPTHTPYSSSTRAVDERKPTSMREKKEIEARQKEEEERAKAEAEALEAAQAGDSEAQDS